MNLRGNFKSSYAGLGFAAALFLAGALSFWFSVGFTLHNVALPLTWMGSEDVGRYAQARNVVENGWISIPYPNYGAPFPVDQSQNFHNAYGLPHSLVFAGVGLLTGDPIVLLNLVIVLMVGLTALSAGLCLRILGIKWPIAFLLALAYAHAYAMRRGIVGHMVIIHYMVPPVLTLAVIILSKRFSKMARHVRYVLPGLFLLACAGFDYYAFFALLTIGFASLGVFLSRTPWRLRLLAAGLCVLGAATLVAWKGHLITGSGDLDDKPPLYHKSIYPRAGQADTYPLTVRNMLTPHNHYRGPLSPVLLPLRDKIREVFPAPQREHSHSALGTVGAAGFLVLVVSVLTAVPMRAGSPRALLHAAAGLAVMLTLWGTLEGFGSLFAVLVAPHARVLSRLAPHVLFLTYFAIGFIFSPTARDTNKKLSFPRVALYAVGILCASLALVEGLDYRGIKVVTVRERAIRDFTQMRSLIETIEERLEPGAMVYQFPWTITGLGMRGLSGNNPRDVHRLPRWQHWAPRIISEKIRWSDGEPGIAAGIDKKVWHDRFNALPLDTLMTRLLIAGFDGAWIDRRGYPDGGESVVNALAAPDTEPITGEYPHVVFVDLSRARRNLIASLGEGEYARVREEFLKDPVPSYQWNDVIDFTQGGNSVLYLADYRRGWGRQEREGTTAFNTPVGGPGLAIPIHNSEGIKEFVLRVELAMVDAGTGLCHVSVFSEGQPVARWEVVPGANRCSTVLPNSNPKARFLDLSFAFGDGSAETPTPDSQPAVRVRNARIEAIPWVVERE